MAKTEILSFTASRAQVRKIKSIAREEEINRSWFISFLCTFALETLSKRQIKAAIKADPRSRVRVRLSGTAPRGTSLRR